jgi:hypothetical protein
MAPNAPTPPRERKKPIDFTAIRNAEVELSRCARLLLPLFPDSEFKSTSPEVELQDHAPLPEEPTSVGGHRILIAQRELNRSVEDLLTVVLHKLVHLANAFAWARDCNRVSRHNGRFRALAEEVGLTVNWLNARYGWAKTTPTANLRRLFRDLALADDVLEPFRWSLSFTRPMIWHCGQFTFPERAELGAILGLPANRDLPKLQVRGMTVSKLWREHDWVPSLRLTGQWLRSFGFPESCRVRVDARYGNLRIQAREL